MMPGRQRRSGRQKIMAVIDTSGSITPHLLELINGELVRLARDYPVVVVECDEAIKAVYSYRRIKKVTGRGGTDFRPVFDPDFVRRHRPNLSCTSPTDLARHRSNLRKRPRSGA